MLKKIFIGIILLLIVGGYFITKEKDYNLKENNEDRISFVKDLSGWMVQLFGNTKDIAEEIKDKDWLPEKENSTNK